MPDTVVAVAAHAADMEFSAGAVLLKEARQGCETHIIQLTLGEKGSATLGPDAYGAQKRAEAEAAAEILGCRLHFMPFADGELFATEGTARDIAAAFRRLRPRILITHWPGSIHSDHTAAHDIVRRAIFVAANRQFELDGLAPTGVPRLYFADNWEDPTGFEPYVYLDVSDEVEAWKKAFECFAIGRGEGGYPYWDWYEARTRLHGIRIGKRHAMAFAVDPRSLVSVRDAL